MPIIMLMMHRKAIVQDLMGRLGENSNIQVICEHHYQEAEVHISSYDAKIALIEAAESGLYDMVYCLNLCKRFRTFRPECKLILMCSEQDEKSVQQVVAAKLKNQIDDFVFYDVTTDYLATKIMSI